MQSFSKLHKRIGPIFPRGSVSESSLFVHNGQLLAISFNRSSSPLAIEFRNVLTGAFVCSHAWAGAAFGNIMRDTDGTLRIIGSQNSYTAGNSLIMATLDPVTLAPTTTGTVYTAPAPYAALNSGICKTPTGYLVALDVMDMTTSQQERSFFLRSTDLVTWTRFADFAPGGRFMGALKPFYLPNNPYCHIAYIAASSGSFGFGNPPYFMAISRTLDFITYDTRGPFIYPEYPVDDINNSDGSQPVEFGSVTFMNYMAGDQATWSELRSVLYPGSLASLMAAVFP